MIDRKLEKILSALRQGLGETLGDKLDAVYLFGSQARGNALPDSDIDVLIVIREDFDYFTLLERTSDLVWKLSLDNEVLITRVFVSREQFDQSASPFLMNVSRDLVLI
jgi:predicted nucleotidyltransferase